jgi:hypothetical protein
MKNINIADAGFDLLVKFQESSFIEDGEIKNFLQIIQGDDSYQEQYDKSVKLLTETICLNIDDQIEFCKNVAEMCKKLDGIMIEDAYLQIVESLKRLKEIDKVNIDTIYIN